jgi:hypothetical protein
VRADKHDNAVVYEAPMLEELGTVEDYTASIGISIIVHPGGGGGVVVNGGATVDAYTVNGTGGAVVSTQSTPPVTLPVTT